MVVLIGVSIDKIEFILLLFLMDIGFVRGSKVLGFQGAFESCYWDLVWTKKFKKLN